MKKHIIILFLCLLLILSTACGKEGEKVLQDATVQPNLTEETVKNIEDTDTTNEEMCYIDCEERGII